MRIRAVWFIVMLVMLGTATGCDQKVWEHGYDSPAAIGQAVVDGLNLGESDTLHRLRVNRDEYLSWIWPAFPASRPPQSFPGDFAWSNLNKRCVIGVRKWLGNYGCKNLMFVDIRFERPTETYKRFNLHRGTVLTVQQASGEKVELRILGSVVERTNRYKLLSYKD